MPKQSHYDVIWTAAANADFESVLDYISQRNPERAKELLRRFQKQVETLHLHPQRGRFVPETMAIGLDIYRELILTPYRTIFRIRGKHVYIMGFFDGRRDLEDVLFERLGRF